MAWHRGVWAAVGLALITAAACGADIQSGIDTANDLFYRQQYLESERLYRKLLKRMGPSDDLSERQEAQRLLILDRLGKLNAHYLNQPQQAIKDFTKLVREYPGTAQAFAARATMADIYLHKLGDLHRAVDEFHTMVSDAPDRAESRWAQLQIVRAYMELKNYDQARTEAEALINRWPKESEAAQAWFQIANSYYVQGRYAEAIATYERLLEQEPDEALASLVLFELGNCFQELGQSERALAYFYGCLKDHPNPILVQNKIKRVRQRLRNVKPATGIHVPDYLRKRLASVPGQVEVEVEVPAPARRAVEGGGRRTAAAPLPRIAESPEEQGRDLGPETPTVAPPPQAAPPPPPAVSPVAPAPGPAAAPKSPPKAVAPKAAPPATEDAPAEAPQN